MGYYHQQMSYSSCLEAVIISFFFRGGQWCPLWWAWGVWTTGQVHPRATWPMEVVTVSIYVIPEASSCTTWLAHIIASVGSIITFDCMCSRGTLKAVTGPLAGRPLPPQSQGAGLLLALVLETWVRVNLVLPSLFASALPPFGIELSLLQNSSGSASALTHQMWERFVLWWWLAGRDAALSPNQGTGLGEPLSLSSPHAVPRAWLVLWGPPMGVASSMAPSLVEVSRESLETVNSVQFLKNPSGRATLPKMISSEKETYHSIISCNSRTDLAKRHDWPYVGGLALSAQYCRAWT